MLRRSTPLLDTGRGASAPDVVEWELERGGKTEPAKVGMPEPELASAPDRGLDAQPVPASDRGLDALAVKRLECGAGDAGAARPGGSSTGESGGDIDNELLKTEATRPALQPADDGARRRHRHQARIAMVVFTRTNRGE